MKLRLFAAIYHDRRGVTAVEFALLAPALIAMLLGLLDMAHTMYTVQMLQGAIQQVARNATIEGAASQATALDNQMTEAIRAVAPRAVVRFSRKSYANFLQASRPENYNDLNGNGACDANEPFEDTNGNQAWDTDPGRIGFGGARDVTVYQVFVDYPRIFPVHVFVPGMSRTVSISSRAVLRNQPFSGQSAHRAPATEFCQ